MERGFKECWGEGRFQRLGGWTRKGNYPRVGVEKASPRNFPKETHSGEG